MVGWLLCWFVSLFHSLYGLWTVGSLVDRLDVSRLVDCMFCPLFDWLVGGVDMLAGRLVGFVYLFVGCLFAWLLGSWVVGSWV